MSGLIRLLAVALLMAGSGTASGTASGVAAQPAADTGIIQLRAGTQQADAPRLRMAGGSTQVVEARLQMALPSEPGQHWMLWLPRDPLTDVQVTGPAGMQAATGFFRPMAIDDPPPAGFGFALPADAAGMQQLRLRIEGNIRSAPSLHLMREQDVLRLAGLQIALACAVYAAFATLLVTAMAVYAAVRDRLFLLYAGYVTSALVFMAAANGHLYAWSGQQVIGRLGAHGFWLTVTVFNAVAFAMLLHFAESAASRSPLVRGMRRVLPAMLVPIALACVPLQAAADLMQPVTTIAWGIAMPLAAWALLDAARRGIPMAFATAVALLVLMAASGAHEAMHRAWLADGFLTRLGYQFALVLMSVILFVGLSSRIGLVRKRLHDEVSARRESELRLRREQLHAALARELQAALRDAPETEVAPRAFRLLGQHAGALLGIEGAVVLAEGYQGHGPMQVAADAAGHATLHAVRPAFALLRGRAMGRDPVHLRLEGARSSDDPGAPLFALVPLRLRAPAWAALVLPLAAQPLDGDALDALAEFVQVALRHADEAHASLRLRHTAEHDALTGSLNRRSLDQCLAREFAVAQVAPLAVLFIDIDLFKRVNDTYGHACGDECLRAIAGVLRKELRPGDVLGRYGGEEFLVLLPGQDGAAARVVAERLRQAVERNPLPWQDAELTLTVSIGLAARRDHDADPAPLLARADKALYVAKHEGRNCVRAAPAYSGWRIPAVSDGASRSPVACGSIAASPERNPPCASSTKPPM